MLLMVDLDFYLMVAKLRDRLQSRKGKSLFFVRFSVFVIEKLEYFSTADILALRIYPVLGEESS